MQVNRRQVLKTVGMGGAFFAAGGMQVALAAESKPALLFLSGIVPTMSTSRIFSILDPIVSQNIPVGLVVRFTDAAGNEMDPEGQLADLLRSLIKEYNGLIEVILHEPGLAGKEPYYRMRQASEARARFCRIIGPEYCSQSGLTIATETQDATLDRLTGMRAAGFRNVVLLPESKTKADYWESEVGVLQINGGTPLAFGAEKSTVIKAIDDAESGSGAQILLVTLDDRPMTDEEAFSAGAVIGDYMAVARVSGGLSATFPGDVHARTGRAYGRLVGLRIVQPGKEDTALQELLEGLKSGDVPFTLVGRPAASGESSDDACCALPAGANTPKAIAGSIAVAGTVVVDGTYDAKALAEAGVATVCADAKDTFYGLDELGLFHLPVSFTFDGSQVIRSEADARSAMLAVTGSLRDAVISVTSKAVQDPASRQGILDFLSNMAAKDDGVPQSLEQFRTTIAPMGEPEQLLKAMRHDRSLAIGEGENPEQAEVDALLADAALAWKFFERMADPETGLCPGSVDFYDEEVSAYPFSAMWDVASQILAAISAHSLKTIDDTVFRSYIAKILDHMPTETVLGLRLPPLSVCTTGKQPNERGFDASDLGRLLTALRALDDYTGGEFDISEIVAGWDISGTIMDGRLHSIRDGKMEPLEDSNYVHYAIRGYALWGFAAKEPYQPPDGLEAFDADMYYLELASRNGLISTEPHGLEALEMGFSAPAKTIADTLYSAQLAEHAKTGQYICVSEGTLNREPWFTYQGYQIGSDTPWQVKTIENTMRYRTVGFNRATAMTNTKAAYLWAALRPQAYSQELVKYVRQETKIDDLGFAPGVFLSTGLPMANYTDINTNGVILQSIAYILRGRKPQISGV